jgi:hypothetical protein
MKNPPEELEEMAKMYSALKGFDREQQLRILGWLSARLAEDDARLSGDEQPND